MTNVLSVYLPSLITILAAPLLITLCSAPVNSYIWIGASSKKRAPLELVRFIIKFIEKDGIRILQIRVDEDGALANSAEFCKLLFVNNITIQTTGGYSSDLNGNVEVLNKVLKRGTGAILASAGLTLPYWCYAVVHFACILNFLSFNHDKSKTAYEAWYNKKPQWKNFRIFGCDIYVVTETTSKNDFIKANKHKFLGWGASTALVHYLDSKRSTIKRARHVYFDDYSSASAESDLSPGGQLIRKDNVDLPSLDDTLINLHLRPDPDPFDKNKTIEHKVDISKTNKFPFGIFIQFDEHFGVPFIKEVPSNSPWYTNLPAKFRRNIWLLSVGTTEPITASAAYDAIQFEISKKNNAINVLLCKWEPTTLTQLKHLRTVFDQMQSTKLSRYTHGDNKVTPSANYAIFSPEKPANPQHIGEMMKSKYKIEWIKGLYENYTKNARVGLFTAPFPIEDVPAGHKILNSRVTFKVKTLGEPHMYDLYCRHCANGSVQIKGVDYINSYAVIVTIDSIRYSLALGASLAMIVYSIDVGNAYQTTLIPATQRLCVRCPPFYIEWFKENYPMVPLPPAKTCYVLQAVHSIQGSRTAGQEWFETSSKILVNMGMVRNATDNAVFTFRVGNELLILLSNVDDFLILASSPSVYQKVRNKLTTLFDITTQEGEVIKFLNIRII